MRRRRRSRTRRHNRSSHQMSRHISRTNLRIPRPIRMLNRTQRHIIRQPKSLTNTGRIRMRTQRRTILLLRNNQRQNTTTRHLTSTISSLTHTLTVKGIRRSLRHPIRQLTNTRRNHRLLNRNISLNQHRLNTTRRQLRPNTTHTNLTNIRRRITNVLRPTSRLITQNNIRLTLSQFTIQTSHLMTMRQRQYRPLHQTGRVSRTFETSTNRNKPTHRSDASIPSSSGRRSSVDQAQHQLTDPK